MMVRVFIQSCLAICFTFLVSLLLYSAGAEEEKATYVGENETKCKVCHPEQAKVMLKTKMFQSFSALKEEQQADPKCVKCHVTGYGEESGFKSFKETPKLINVQCEACHGPASLHLKAPITDKEKRKATVKMPTKDDCLKCHNKEFPDFKGFDYEKSLQAIKHWKDKEKGEEQADEKAEGNEQAQQESNQGN